MSESTDLKRGVFKYLLNDHSFHAETLALCMNSKNVIKFADKQRNYLKSMFSPK